jgi:hypothetical protein
MPWREANSHAAKSPLAATKTMAPARQRLDVIAEVHPGNTRGEREQSADRLQRLFPEPFEPTGLRSERRRAGRRLAVTQGPAAPAAR